MKFCKCQNLNSLFPGIICLELPKYSWNLQLLSIIEKFKNWKILLKNNWKIGTPFRRQSWTIGTPLARLRGHVNQAGTHSTYGAQFSKLPYALWKCKCDHETTINLYDMTTLRYIVTKEKFFFYNNNVHCTH